MVKVNRVGGGKLGWWRQVDVISEWNADKRERESVLCARVMCI